MFKKNANRPPIIVSLKKTPSGYRIINNEAHQLFVIKRVTRTMYRPDLIQASNMGMDSQGLSNNLVSSTIIQPPSHVTIPAFAGWFNLDSIHPIEKQFFPEFFQEEHESSQFSFRCKNSKLYKYYRNVIVGMWRQNVKKYISSAQCRRNLLGDVSSIIRIHGFLENWGLINFTSKEHSKGMVLKKSQKLSCYVCQQTNCAIYHIAAVEEDVLFQICDNCFQCGHYPQEIAADEFVQVLHKNYRNTDNKIMNNNQLIKLLDILSSVSGTSRDQDRDAWNAAQRQFSQFTRQDLVYNFLRIPLVSSMNANIFENNEDVVSEKQYEEDNDPSIFQDYQNPLQASIAVSYYKWKNQREQYPNIAAIFDAGEKHARFLSNRQSQKIEQLTKMMVEVTFSKLQLKSLFIHEYEKLMNKSREAQRRIIASNMAESLKQNVRLLERNQQPEILFGYRQSPAESEGLGLLEM